MIVRKALQILLSCLAGCLLSTNGFALETDFLCPLTDFSSKDSVEWVMPVSASSLALKTDASSPFVAASIGEKYGASSPQFASAPFRGKDAVKKNISSNRIVVFSLVGFFVLFQGIKLLSSIEERAGSLKHQP